MIVESVLTVNGCPRALDEKCKIVFSGGDGRPVTPMLLISEQLVTDWSLTLIVSPDGREEDRESKEKPVLV